MTCDDEPGVQLRKCVTTHGEQGAVIRTVVSHCAIEKGPPTRGASASRMESLKSRLERSAFYNV